MGFGVYVHFPYCRAICPYCDFAVVRRKTLEHERYADAVLAELRERASLFDGRRVVSIYFGGGTPSLWEASCIARVVDGVRETLDTSDKIEITVEANPDDLDRARLDALREAGANRLSLGAQSLAPRHLATLGRSHGPSEIARGVEDARAAGFANLSLDLMFALPGQTAEELARDVAGLVALAPDHVSTYALTVEERTPMHAWQKQGRIVLPDAEGQADLAELVERELVAAGFTRYEVSAYAREGKRAVHNQLYWSGGEWLGLGCSAHSFRRLPSLEGRSCGGERWWDVRALDAWLALPPSQQIAGREALTDEALAREAIWLGLRRLADGIDRAAYAARHARDPIARFPTEFARLQREGLVDVTPARVRLTPRGALLADEVGARFV